MREIAGRHVLGQGAAERMRWFSDSRHDLYVWLDDAGSVVQFLFTYDKGGEREQAVHWRAGAAVEHGVIDDGERPGGAKMSPLLTSDGPWTLAEVRARFESASGGVERAISSQVRAALAG